MAASDAAWGVAGALVAGLVVAGFLVWAIRLGIKVRRREQDPSRTSPQPPRPDSGGGPDMSALERREPDEVPRAADESERLTPHQLHPSGSRRSEDQNRPRWESGSGGPFGSSGSGAS
ncbi:DUF6479 family protein [Streptomyces sp. NPDC093228]|uniref:DUF6479 family protein n=1 Tax=unclassified Streptomyces TaxID=2593676 RepID=UPI0007410547|nr:MULTISPECIES: DUF6479 family protein [unclassified Streptomyces]KUJ36644.1 hypothetical protein ADL25_31830 [Streptomyces sp. NRRL F-5122]MDX3265530.1 DUF6479 family protein [Streptomyces sp. MI02-2A]